MKMSYKTIVLTPLVIMFTGCVSHKNTVNNVCKNKLEVTDDAGVSRIVEVKDANELKYIFTGDEVRISALGYNQNRVLKKENLPAVRANRDSIDARRQAEKFNIAKQAMQKECTNCK